MMKPIKQMALFAFAGFSLQASAALVARDLDGNFSNGHEAVYDTVLNITWMADTNLAASNTFGIDGITSEVGVGRMFWRTAKQWIAAMNAEANGAGYLGVNTWRLPTATPLDGSEYYNLNYTFDGSSDYGFQLSAPIDSVYNPFGQSAGVTNSELAYHYYNNFLAIGGCTVTASSPQFCIDLLTSGIYNAPDPQNNNALFFNMPFGAAYWTSSTTYNNSVIGFNVGDGFQFTNGNGDSYLYTWAVADGDIGAQIVPVPAALWFFISALISLFYGAKSLNHVKNLPFDFIRGERS